MVWGGRRLATFLRRALPTQENYGESWEISDHPLHVSVVVGGAWSGRTLHDLVQHDAATLFGSAIAPGAFPWLVKMLDANDWLSVQVHPDDAAAARLRPGERGKTEAWFVLAAEPESRVFAGLLPGVDESKLRNALDSGTVADCLHQFRPRPGDCIFFPAGTVHAVGGGVLFAEVQQTSDVTFRLFDWNRRDARGQARALHIEESLACINWQAGPVNPVCAVGYPGGDNCVAQSTSVCQALVRCEYFGLDYIRQTAPFILGGTGRLQVALVLHGWAILECESEHIQMEAGATWLLPAALPPLKCSPGEPIGLLLATLPSATTFLSA
jgi:mannose-6-phosphate isomerase